MTLEVFDMIQIRGLHPRNPVTGVEITTMLQYFAVTKRVDGDVIPPDALLPIPGIGYPAHAGPILMADVVQRNLRDRESEPTP